MLEIIIFFIKKEILEEYVCAFYINHNPKQTIYFLVSAVTLNHINFRHLPIIAKALDEYEGTMILVSHIDEFVWQVRIDEYLELE